MIFSSVPKISQILSILSTVPLPAILFMEIFKDRRGNSVRRQAENFLDAIGQFRLVNNVMLAVICEQGSGSFMRQFWKVKHPCWWLGASWSVSSTTASPPALSPSSSPNPAATRPNSVSRSSSPALLPPPDSSTLNFHSPSAASANSPSPSHLHPAIPATASSSTPPTPPTIHDVGPTCICSEILRPDFLLDRVFTMWGPHILRFRFIPASSSFPLHAPDARRVRLRLTGM